MHQGWTSAGDLLAFLILGVTFGAGRLAVACGVPELEQSMDAAVRIGLLPAEPALAEPTLAEPTLAAPTPEGAEPETLPTPDQERGRAARKSERPGSTCVGSASATTLTGRC